MTENAWVLLIAFVAAFFILPIVRIAREELLNDPTRKSAELRAGMCYPQVKKILGKAQNPPNLLDMFHFEGITSFKWRGSVFRVSFVDGQVSDWSYEGPIFCPY